MRRFTSSIRLALAAGDWYGALSTALTLPDICGRLESPNARTGERYVNWYRQWMQPRYTIRGGGVRPDDVMLSGDDCYALRCSYIHEGGGNVLLPRGERVLEGFRFITPPQDGNVIHMNQLDGALQLQVDLFCSDVAESVEAWANFVATNAEVQARMAGLLEIFDSARGIRL